MSGLCFRLDGSQNIVAIPARPQDCGPGSIIVLNCSEDVHAVAVALKKYVKSNCHVNACDERQIVDWRDVVAAMNAGEGVFAASTVRED